jgi:ketosteroid isomerase-like protein
MTIKIYTAVLLIPALFASCGTNDSATTDRSEQAKKEIAQVEKDFEKMAAEKGVAEAFGYYADSSAVMKGNLDSVITGKDGIKGIFTGERFKNATVKWSADFIDAAASGELGYTYGKYRWEFRDSTGKITESKGIFHTVWKKQADGTWRFVWD